MSNKIAYRKRKLILEACNGRCWYCGVHLYWPRHHNETFVHFQNFNERQWRYLKRNFLYTIDHIIPPAHGGQSVAYGNLRPSCNTCNSRKGRLTTDQFRASLLEYIPDTHPATKLIDSMPFCKSVPRSWILIGDNLIFYGEQEDGQQGNYYSHETAGYEFEIS